MDNTSEQSGRTEQAAPTAAVSSQTANPGQERPALDWQAAVHQGFSTFRDIVMAPFNAVCRWYRAYAAMTWTALLTTSFCLAASFLVVSWLLKIMWSIAMCDTSELGGWLGAIAAFFTQFRCSAPSQLPVPSSTLTSVLPLSRGVTAVAELLATEYDSLVAASISATAVASVANKAFPDLGHEGLKGQRIVQADWPAIALAASKESTAIIDRFYAELRNEDRVLANVGRVAGPIAGKDSGKAHGSNFLAVFRGPGLKQRQEICQRTLGSLSMLVETGQQARDNFRASFGDFRKRQLEHLTVLVKLEHGNNKNARATVQATGPGDFFQFVIDRLNKKVFEPKAGTLWGRAACSDPDQASFVRGIHTAGGAGVMFDSAFIGVLDRLDKLSDAMDMERAWIENNLKMWLNYPSSKPECPTTRDELQIKVEEVVSLAEEWRRKLQELYHS